MKTKVIFSLLLTLLLSSCQAQEAKKENDKSIDLEKNKQQTNIIVNKEYDDEGNLIRYDSTYSSYYSNIQGDSLMGDSIMKSFRNDLFKHFPMSRSPFFKSFFFEDSLSDYDFYKNDFFRERYRLNQERMEELFWEMDSIKNHFFNEQQFEE
ncbi:MAG: hypothetical protein WD530_03125 [Vicingaceae bacterium]